MLICIYIYIFYTPPGEPRAPPTRARPHERAPRRRRRRRTDRVARDGGDRSIGSDLSENHRWCAPERSISVHRRLGAAPREGTTLRGEERRSSPTAGGPARAHASQHARAGHETAWCAGRVRGSQTTTAPPHDGGRRASPLVYGPFAARGFSWKGMEWN